MKILFTENAWEEFTYWTAHDPDMAERIIALIRETTRTPFKGIGKPEALRHGLKGFWSRRITDEHRLVYQVSGKDHTQTLSIVQCRFHYDE